MSENGFIHPEMDGGERGEENLLSPAQENRLIKMLAKAGQTFNLHQSVRSFMVKRSCRIAKGANAKYANGAIKNLIAMAALDQKDLHHAQDAVLDKNDKRQAGGTTVQTVIILPDNGRRTIEVNGEAK